jgi:hypothetical protein
MHLSTRKSYFEEYVQLVAAAMSAIIQANATDSTVSHPAALAREACDYADAALNEILNRSERAE